MTAAFRFHMAYRGDNFSGFQTQANARTVQEELQQALRIITGQSLILKTAGRTDAGVHAEGQVASCELFTTMSLRQLTLALLTKLPSDMSVWRIDKLPLGFDARRHSVGKQYIYRLSQGLIPDLCVRERSWHIRTPLDMEAMQAGAGFLLGEHDFESFRSVLCGAAHAIRYIWHIGLKRRGSLIEIDIRGNAFCLNMVRIIVGTLVDVGRGKLKPEDVGIILAARDRRKASMTAKAQGLTFNRVYYPDDLSEADIPAGIVFPRFPVSKDSWPFLRSEIEYGPT